MNKATVPIIARLQTLQKPAQFSFGGARVIADAANPSPLTALLREVNETILGRALRFESSGGTSLTLESVGRRVLRVADATGLPGAESCLAAEVLEDELKDDLIKLMQALATPGHELRVVISARGVTGDGVSVGLPVALLADLLLIDLNDPAVANPPDADEVPGPEPVAPDGQSDRGTQSTARISLARFAAGLGPILMAWVIRGGESDRSSEGPDEMVTHLNGFMADEDEALRRQLDLVSGTPGGAACMVLGAALDQGQGVLCARSGDGLLLGLIEGNPAQILVQAWTEARA